MCKYCLILVLSSALIASCGGKKVHKIQQASCSCSSYLPGLVRPEWVDAEKITTNAYISSGISECTGIQSFDFKTADQTARSNLTRMVNTHVQSEVLSVKGDYGFGAGYNKGEVRSLLESEAFLDNSSIFSRWVDPQTCVIYSGVQIAKADVTNAIKKIAKKNDSKLLNQTFSVTSNGELKSVIERRLITMLGKAGVNKVSPSALDTAYILKAHVAEHDYASSSNVVRAQLFLQILSPEKKIIWSKQLSGKGVSFKKKGKNVMLGIAVEDALEKALDDLIEVLSRSKP